MTYYHSMMQQDISERIKTIAATLEAAIERRDQSAQQALKSWSGPLAVDFRNAILAENQAAKTLIWQLGIKANFSLANK